MWFLAGALLGVVGLASILGFHLGHVAHAVAAVAGVAAAGALIAIVATGNTGGLVLTLLGADAVVTVGVGTMAWRGLSDPRLRAGVSTHSVVGQEGVALGTLNPSGVVRVRGENWSATSANGRVEEGGRVQVIGAEGIRLTVWGEHELLPSTPDGIEREHTPGAIPASGTDEGKNE
jgi:membrane protein implicated in regulation of membrane protease activity